MREYRDLTNAFFILDGLFGPRRLGVKNVRKAEEAMAPGRQ